MVLTCKYPHIVFCLPKSAPHMETPVLDGFTRFGADEFGINDM